MLTSLWLTRRSVSMIGPSTYRMIWGIAVYVPSQLSQCAAQGQKAAATRVGRRAIFASRRSLQACSAAASETTGRVLGWHTVCTSAYQPRSRCCTCSAGTSSGVNPCTGRSSGRRRRGNFTSTSTPGTPQMCVLTMHQRSNWLDEVMRAGSSLRSCRMAPHTRPQHTKSRSCMRISAALLPAQILGRGLADAALHVQCKLEEPLDLASLFSAKSELRRQVGVSNAREGSIPAGWHGALLCCLVCCHSTCYCLPSTQPNSVRRASGGQCKARANPRTCCNGAARFAEVRARRCGWCQCLRLGMWIQSWKKAC